MIVKDFTEMVDRVREEFLHNGFKESKEDGTRIVLTAVGKTVIVANVGRCVQIFLDFAHDWSLDVFPRLSAVTVCGNSIFYYGRLQDDE